MTAGTPISVTRSATIRHREHVAVPAPLVHALGLTLGQQVIIRRDAGTFALYTVVDGGLEPGPARLSRAGQNRIGGADERHFPGFLDPVAVDPAATEQEARTGEKLRERLDDDGHHRGLVVLSPHGGDIERFTERQAEHVALLLRDLGVSCWRCEGWKPRGGAAVRWHITSTDLSPVSFPRLATIATRGFEHAVSFHGFTDPTRADILVGGAAPDPIKRRIHDAIADAVAGTGLTVEITGPGHRLAGRGEANLVNRLTRDHRHGVQLEQQPHARTEPLPGTGRPGWQAIAAAVASTYRTILTTGASTAAG